MYFKLSIVLIVLLIASCKSPKRNTYEKGTCIVIGRGRGGIWVAADSRRVINFAVDGKRFSVLRYDTVCKIHQCGDLFFASAGVNVVPVDSIAEKCLMENHSISDAAKDFSIKAKIYQTAYLESIRINDPKDFDHYFKDLQYVGCCFFGYENDIPKMIDVGFKIESKKNSKVVLKDSSIYYLEPPTTVNFVLMGHTDSIRKIVGTSKFWKGKKPEDGLRELVSIECDRDPVDVARPISVLSVTSSTKHTWSKDSPCATR
jgi:hypothetical protein